MKEVLKLRNYIVHDYFKEKINLIFIRNGRNALISELSDYIEKVKSMDKRLMVISDELYQKLGITDELLLNELVKIKEEERRKEFEH
ncbi:hypothetical protein ABU162_26680 [Paenibacillus thiaminolyticus]|uniref:hypothetical protein n=1 Tax=Paenibacillus thiaminolyticus TaxID=49283 RepID=UPI0035A65F3E